MCREWQPKVTIIKESHDLKTLDVSTLFEKLTEHEHELKKLEDKNIIPLKASISNVKVEEDDVSTDKDSSKE